MGKFWYNLKPRNTNKQGTNIKKTTWDLEKKWAESRVGDQSPNPHLKKKKRKKENPAGFTRVMRGRNEFFFYGRVGFVIMILSFFSWALYIWEEWWDVSTYFRFISNISALDICIHFLKTCNRVVLRAYLSICWNRPQFNDGNLPNFKFFLSYNWCYDESIKNTT
jgi:hypothetical protein